MIRTVESSPKSYARFGGGLYLVIIVLGIFAEALVRGRLVSPDAMTTVANLTAMGSLWRFGVAAEFVALVCTVALAMIYYVLLRPVSRELNLFALLLRMVAIAVQTVAVLNLISALFPLGENPYLRAFTAEQLAALTNLAIKTHSQWYGMSLLVLGFCFLIHGYLIFRSEFLPKVLGILIQVAGVGYATNGFTMILAPAAAGKVFMAIIPPVFVGELTLSLWLLLKGVNEEKWRQMNANSTVARIAAH